MHRDPASLNALKRAPLAYARIRGSLRPGDPEMPHWDDLTESAQKLLCTMWYLGAEDALLEAATTMKEIE